MNLNCQNEIPENFFAANIELEVIDLSFNRLRQLKAVHISHLNKLKTLDLQNNQIVYLDLRLIEYLERS